MFKKLKKLFPFGEKFIGIKRRQVSEQNELTIAAERSKPFAFFILLLMWGVSAVILNLPQNKYYEHDFVEKQKSPRNIFAKFDYSYVDEIATKKAREEAIAEVPLYYEVSSQKNEAIKDIFPQFLEALRQREKIENAQGQFKDHFGSSISALVAELPNKEFEIFNNFNRSKDYWEKLKQEIDTLILAGIISFEDKNSHRINDKVKIIDLAGRERAVKPMSELTDSKDLAAKIAFIISDNPSAIMLKVLERLYEQSSNLVYDSKRTEATRAEVAAKVPNVMVEVSKNSPIVSKGEVITLEILLSLNTYNEQYAQNFNQRNYGAILQKIVFSLLLVLFIGFYIYHIHPDIMSSNFKILTLASVTIIAMVINYFSMELFYILSQTYRVNQNLIINFVPIALASVILVTMLGFRVSIYVGFYIASAMSVITENTFEFAFIGIISSSISALIVRKAKNHREFFIRTFLAVAMCDWLLNVNVLQYYHNVSLIYKSAAVAAASGLITAILAQTIIYFYELVFNVTTNMSLLVLCDYSHPLLERLKREAPGTFYHSIMVATLAEDAAKAIKANPIKAKCGALFHDIGKLENPEYFTENNIESENKHLHLSPQNSFMLIRNHVKDGLRLAKRYKLNQVIKNAIVQHHGNDLSYFYYQAQSLSGAEDITEEQFRYHGTPPRSKEMVIISLADACEAAVRSIEKPTTGKIEAMIDEIFKKRFRDNQLINAEVTCGELKKIRDSFVANLISMNHGRIAYKKEKDNESDLFMESK